MVKDTNKFAHLRENSGKSFALSKEITTFVLSKENDETSSKNH